MNKYIKVTGCHDCSKKKFEELYFYWYCGPWYCGPEDANVRGHVRFNITVNVAHRTINEECLLDDLIEKEGE
jgi:hypothetical protein